ncbi:hypothetical protein PWG14_26145 [Chromobacterium amazonense]|uniref:hypothetical protein n=1 Tax=Chromobacterium amazonense TaxID=1382803 RepID=UPI00237DF4D7|nr:hypothetical protein [Chromobacterium amazonense]MDE1715949.1 hypothetical protein [Chromobacterium amazonense]
MSDNFDFEVIDALYASGYHGPRALDKPEFYWRSMLGSMVAYRDSFFRPLGEEIAPPDAREGVEMLAVKCDYEGSRFHHSLPMNLSSLRQFGKHWHIVLPTISLLREQHQIRRSGSEKVSMADLWFISKLCQLLPAYLIRREFDTVDPDSIPVVPSIIYRISLGMHRIVHISLIKQMASGGNPAAPSLDSDAYYHIAEAAGLLVGRNSVCAGPQAMVEQAYRSMIEPVSISGAEDSAADAGFHRYAALFMKLELEKYLFAVQAAIQLRTLIADLQALPQTARPEAFVKELIRFEDWSAENTSPLAHEIAREDLAMLLQGDQEAIALASACPAGTVRHRMQAGLNALVAIADQLCRSSLENGSQLLAEVTALRMSSQRGEPWPGSDRLRQRLSAPAAALATDAIENYLGSERQATAIFQLLQQQITEALGASASESAFGPADIAAVFGPRLSQCFADCFPETCDESQCVD